MQTKASGEDVSHLFIRILQWNVNFSMDFIISWDTKSTYILDIT